MNLKLTTLILIFFAFFPLKVCGVCGDYIIDPGETCDDGNINSSDGCSSSCLVEYDYKCWSNENNRSVCYINKPFSAFLQYITLSTPFELNLTFNKPFTFDEKFLSTRMSINISGLNSSTDFTWKLLKSNEKTMFKIELDFKVSFLSQIATVTFNNTDNRIIDVFNESLGVGSQILTAKIPLYIIYSEIEENYIVFMKYFINLVFIIMVFCFILLSILNSLTVFWNFLGFYWIKLWLKVFTRYLPIATFIRICKLQECETSKRVFKGIANKYFI